MTLTVNQTQTSLDQTSLRFGRVAGVAGLAAVAIGIAFTAATGDPPGLRASASEVAAHFGQDPSLRRVAVLVPALLGIPIALFFSGVHRSLRQADDRRGTAWATMFLYGAIMMSATSGLGEVLYSVGVLREGSGSSPEVLRLLLDAGAMARATLGAWIAVAVGAVAAATFTTGLRPRWYGWYCTVAALLGAAAVADTVSTGGGLLSQLAFVIGFLLFMVITSVFMLRDPA